jgi:hypothetical protein
MMEAAQMWFSNNNLIVNIEKTTAMLFRNHQNKGPTLPQIFFEDSIIPVSSGTKFLGIHINERLKWNKHCDSLNSKLNTGHYLSIDFKKSLTHI